MNEEEVPAYQSPWDPLQGHGFMRVTGGQVRKVVELKKPLYFMSEKNILMERRFFKVLMVVGSIVEPYRWYFHDRPLL